MREISNLRMPPLASEASRFERLPISDADIYYLPTTHLDIAFDILLHRLINEISWRHEHISLWGRQFLQPRLVAWYGDRGSDYTYSGITMRPRGWTTLLLGIKRSVEAAAGASFNSVLINYYRDHRDSMGLHSDDERELGAQPTIGSLSLGAERTFVMKHRLNRSSVRLRLASGSLLLMRGETQRFWRHGVAKESRPCGPRVNLTFRTILDLS